MNLGQLIGQLRLRVDTLEEQIASCTCGAARAEAHRPEAPCQEETTDEIGPAVVRPQRRVDAKGQVLRILKEAGGPMKIRAILQRTENLFETNVSVAILALLNEKKIKRTGEKMHYEYEFAGDA